ncbi:MAG: amidohydrolase family protein [Desulfovibrio sp.]
MFTDTHTHVFHPKIAEKAINQLHTHYGIHPRGTGVLDDLLARADRAGIGRVVVHTAATDPSQVIPANNWALDMERQSTRVTAFGTLHPDYPEPEKELERLRKGGIKGLKFHPDFQGFFLDDPKFYKLMEIVGDEFTLMIHVGDTLPPDKNPSCPLKMAKLRHAFPGPRLIAAHLGGFSHWRYSVEHLAGLDVFFDSSSSLSFIDDDTLRDLLAKHPADQLLFGSDYPLFDPADEIALVQRRMAPLGVKAETLLTAGTLLFPEREAK